ncbi:EP1-like glycoprotein 2 [Papaver somniferum]|uniref:EP1-like glycoprotein 2 n=1 Tax=Papaver somniferum TaxID=3469 RepID=UPI000E70424B|nr:EP1-like glycoprotein 2 [Papaver somniferum]
MKRNNPSAMFILIFMIIFYLSSVVDAVSVLISKTFKFVNEEANRKLDAISNHPFSLQFYNNAANKYTLALGMGIGVSNSRLIWVWAANRGRPVGENAVLSFGRNGNLVLVDADGRVAWQTRTANKGVVDIKLLPNGNLVLLGGFVWQSFDYPSDTLLNGQGLRPGGANNKLVSRLSETDDSPGPYSLVINDPNNLNTLLFLATMSTIETKINVERPQKFNGKDFKRWQSKMLFFPSNHDLDAVLQDPLNVLMNKEDNTDADNDYYIRGNYMVKNNIMNGLEDAMYDFYNAKDNLTAYEL